MNELQQVCLTFFVGAYIVGALQLWVFYFEWLERERMRSIVLHRRLWRWCRA